MILAQTVIPAVDPMGLPASPWWFVSLLLLTLLLHFLFMNLVLGGSILALLLNAAACFGRRDTARMAGIIYQVMPPAISMAITMGVAPLLFVQVLYGPFFYSANVLLGLAWFAFVLFLLTGFYLTYWLTYRASNRFQQRVGAWENQPGKRLLVSALAVLCFLAVGWTLAHNHELSLHPERWAVGDAWASPRWFTPTPTLLPRYLHDVVGATAVGGLWVAGIGWWLRRRGAAEPEVHTRLIRYGLTVATVLTFSQILIGFTFLLRLEEPVRTALLGFNTLFGSIWTVTLALAVLLPMLLMYAAQRPEQFKPFALSALATVVVLLGMLVGREQIRTSALARPEAHNFSITQWTVWPQHVSMLVFFVLLAVGLITVGLMLYWITDRRGLSTGEPPAPPAA